MNEQLFDALENADTIDELLNYCAHMANQPMWIMDEGYSIIAMSQSPNALKYYEKYFDNGKNISLWFHEWFSQEFIDRVSHYPSRIHDELLQMDVIATDICIKNKRIARLTVLLENNEDTTVSFVNDVAKVLAIMLRNQRNQENNSPLSELIKYLVDNDQVDIAKISNYLELSKVKLHKQYYVGIVESKENMSNRKTQLTYWMTQFKVTFPNDFILLKNDQQLVMVIGSLDNLVHFYNHYIQHQHGKLAYSYPFNDLMQLKTYYHQAQFALNESNENLIDFQTVKMEYIMYRLSDVVPIKSLIHPIVLKILVYDDTNNTDYFKTLDTYVNQSMMKEKCAQLLHVHVNTIKYRMHQMEQLFAIDFNDLNLLYDLSFSCQLIHSSVNNI